MADLSRPNPFLTHPPLAMERGESDANNGQAPVRGSNHGDNQKRLPQNEHYHGIEFHACACDHRPPLRRETGCANLLYAWCRTTQRTWETASTAPYPAAKEND